jgi:copper chaperone CopZ
MITQTFKISGLDCAACKKLVEKRISTLGVSNVNVSLETKTVEIKSDRNIDISEVNKVLEGTPYEAKN